MAQNIAPALTGVRRTVRASFAPTRRLTARKTDTDANLEIARNCFDLAVASQNDPYRTAFDANTFLDGARAHFALCVEARAMEHTDQYEIRIYERGVWLG